MKINLTIVLTLIYLISSLNGQTPQLSVSAEGVKEKTIHKHWRLVLGMYKNSIVSLYHKKAEDGNYSFFVRLTDKETLKLTDEIKVDKGKYKDYFIDYGSQPYLVKNNIFFCISAINEEKNIIEIGCLKVNLDTKKSDTPVSFSTLKRNAFTRFYLSKDSSKMFCLSSEGYEDKTVLKTLVFGTDLKILSTGMHEQAKESEDPGTSSACGYVYPNGDCVAFCIFHLDRSGSYEKRRYNSLVMKVSATGEKTTVNLGTEVNKFVDHDTLCTDADGKLYLVGAATSDYNSVFGIASADIEKCLNKTEGVNFTGFSQSFRALRYIYPFHPTHVLPVPGKAGEFYLIAYLGGKFDGSKPLEDLSRNIFCFCYDAGGKKEVWSTVLYRDVFKHTTTFYHESGLSDFNIFLDKSSLVIFYQNHINNEAVSETRKLDRIRKIGKNSCVVEAKIDPSGKVQRNILFDNKENKIDPLFYETNCFISGKALYCLADDDGLLKMIAIKNIF